MFKTIMTVITMLFSVASCNVYAPHPLVNEYYKGYTPKSVLNRTSIEDFISMETLPVEFDWRDHGIVNPVKNQGHCGSCWAFSGISVLESQVMKYLNTSISLSEQEVVDCVKNVFLGMVRCCNGCEGGEMVAVFKYFMKQDSMDDTEQQYSYTGKDGKCHKLKSKVHTLEVSDFKVLPVGSEDQIMSALVRVGPLSIGVDASQWSEYTGGIFDHTKCSSDQKDQDHGVVLVGYGTNWFGEDYWVVRNSWSEDWGEEGYIRLKRGVNACGMANTVSWPILQQNV